MIANVLRCVLVPLLGLAPLVPLTATPASAALGNDDLANATIITALPFTDSTDLDGATTEPGEPQVCYQQMQTGWYAFTPVSTAVIAADLEGSDYGVVLNVYRSTGGFDGLGFIGCASPGGAMAFTASAGTTYYIQAGSYFTGPVHLQLNVRVVPPPANDNFADAVTIGALPTTSEVDMSGATTEVGEPVFPSGAYQQIVASAWYTFTPAVTASLSVTASVCCVTPFLTAYTGSSLTGLTEVASRSSSYQPLTFRAIGGTTYHVQLGRGETSYGFVPMSLRFELTPPPVADFYLWPGDPSIFDTVQFRDYSYDPGQAGIESEEWTLGDGTTSTGCCPAHRYAADADYSVRLDIATTDGRTGSKTLVVHVKTHDVSIAKLDAPDTTRVGRTSRITAQISDTRYAEVVQVQLFKSVPGGDGFELVGTLTQSIPAQSKAQTTPFDFDYTFTGDDAAIGKVSFKAVATIVGASDALPADNIAIAPPTKVRP